MRVFESGIVPFLWRNVGAVRFLLCLHDFYAFIGLLLHSIFLFPTTCSYGRHCVPLLIGLILHQTFFFSRKQNS
jgi:hypothetical protein